MKKIPKEAGYIVMVLLAAAVILLLRNMQPSVSNAKTQTASPALNSADAAYEIVPMRADAFIKQLQRVRAKHAGISFNAADTSGKTITVTAADEATGRETFLDERTLSAEQMNIFNKNDISVNNAASIRLPVSREKGILLVKVPAVMAYSMTK